MPGRTVQLPTADLGHPDHHPCSEHSSTKTTLVVMRLPWCDVFFFRSVVRSRQSGRTAEENPATISHLDWSEAEYHEPVNGEISVDFLDKHNLLF